MQRLSASRLAAISAGLRRLDPPTAQALEAHAAWLASAEAALREANIQLAAPLRPTATVTALRDRIDHLLDIVPRPIPINQADEE